jgi:hypothetical protein
MFTGDDELLDNFRVEGERKLLSLRLKVEAGEGCIVDLREWRVGVV